MGEVTGISEVSEKQEHWARGLSKSEKLVVLQRWMQTMRTTINYVKALDAVTGLDVEGVLRHRFNELMEAYTQNTAALLGDKPGWLCWYWFDSDMGAKVLEAGFGDDVRTIRTVEDLLWLIEEV